MKYVDEFRRQDLAKKLASDIANEADPSRTYHVMEFCGGHTHAIFRYGVQDLMPKNVKFVHGPGCPVCVLPIPRIDNAIELANKPDVILCTYGDMMRVPASRKNSLLKAKAAGADIRMIYSTQDAIQLAEENPDKKIIFFAIGFETTTPPTAVVLKQAKTMNLKNFYVFCNHVLTPSAMTHILETSEDVVIDGFLGPSHVSSIIGYRPYEPFANQYKKPVVIAGFEPLDVMLATLMVIRQVNQGEAKVENQYIRVVTAEGNMKAQELVSSVLELRDTFEWRGLGFVEKSALKIKDEYSAFDAEKHFSITESQGKDVKGCECPAILRGQKKPTDCKLFGTICTPENPQGSCMVSSEGSCAAYWTYGRFRLEQNNTPKKAVGA